MDSALQVALTQTLPLDFSLLNANDEPALYFTAGQSEQEMHLTISNGSGEDLTLAALDTVGTDYHFELVFRPGVLLKEGKAVKIAGPMAAGCTLHQRTNPDGTVSLLLRLHQLVALAHGEALIFLLQHVAPDNQHGSHSHSTRVMLRYRHVQLRDTATPVSGSRIGHLNLVSHLGQAHIPLHLGFAGPDTVPTTGAEQTLMLSLTNTSGQHTIDGSAGQFVLRFDAGPESWQLAPAAQLQAIEVLVEGGSVKRNEDPPEWYLQLPALEPLQPVHIHLHGVSTTNPPGQTQVRLDYANVPGYWDGQLVTSLTKTDPTLSLLALQLSPPDTNSSPGDEKQAAGWQLSTQPAASKAEHSIFWLYQGAGTLGRMSVDGQGRVSVGPDPAREAQLEVDAGTHHHAVGLHSQAPSGTWATISNRSTGGKSWYLVATGPTNSEGAGNFMLHHEGSPRLVLTSQGLAGIGGVPRQAKLEVNVGDQPYATDLLSYCWDGTWQSLTNTSTGGRRWHFASTGQGCVEGAGKLLIHHEGGSRQHVVLDPEGRTGFGLVPTRAKLEVATDQQYTADFRSNHVEGTWQSLTNTSPGGRRWNLIATGSGNGEGAGHLLVHHDDAPQARVVIKNDGRVGIGTISPSELLQVGDLQLGDARLAIKGTSTAALTLSKRNPNYEVEQRPESTAELGFLDLDRSLTLVNHKTQAQLKFADNGAIYLQGHGITMETAGTISLQAEAVNMYTANARFAVQSDGNVVVYRPNSHPIWSSGSNVSDARLKTDVQPITSPLARLLALRGVSFRWKDPGMGTAPELGVIAQEVEQVFPELLHRLNGQDTKMVQYEKFVPVLIEAMREQQQQIEALRTELRQHTQQATQ